LSIMRRPPMGIALQQEIAARDRLLGQHTDVERVTVTFDARPSNLLCTKTPYVLTAERPWDQSIQRGADVGKFLRTVNFQNARRLVEFVLHRITWHHFNIRRNDRWHIWTDSYAMPGVRPQQQSHEMLDGILDCFMHARRLPVSLSSTAPLLIPP